MARTQTDWPALKLEYVNSTMSLRELAERHSVAWSAANGGTANASC